MEHLQQEEYPVFLKNNEDLFLDSLLDLLDDWSDDSSQKTSISENTSNEDDVLIKEIIALAESPFPSTPPTPDDKPYVVAAMQEPYPLIELEEGSGSKVTALRLCHICGEKAGKHVYYGGQCCPSCRAFFRRSVQNNFFKQFTCSSKTNACVINVSTRKTCQLCRFQGCLSAGMRVSWVLPDGERTSKKPRVRIQSSLPSLDHPGGLNYKEISFVFSVKSTLCNKFMEKVTALVNSSSEFLLDFVQYLAFPSTAETSYLRLGMSLEKIEFLSLIAQGMSPELKVSQRDMLVLYNYNFRHIHLYRESCSLSKRECPSMSSLIDSVQVLNIQDSSQIIEKVHKIKEFSIEHFILQYKLRPHEDERHARVLHLVDRISTWSSEKEDERDDFCYIIMIYILFFDLSNGVSRMDLDDPQGIDAIKLRYVEMLNRYCQKKYPSSVVKKFLDGIMLPSLVAEASQLSFDIGLCSMDRNCWNREDLVELA